MHIYKYIYIYKGESLSLERAQYECPPSPRGCVRNGRARERFRTQIIKTVQTACGPSALSAVVCARGPADRSGSQTGLRVVHARRRGAKKVFRNPFSPRPGPDKPIHPTPGGQPYIEFLRIHVHADKRTQWRRRRRRLLQTGARRARNTRARVCRSRRARI